MFFELNDAQKKFQKKLREIFERDVSPLVDEYERKEAFPISLFRTLWAERLLCPRCPKEYDGRGLDKISECISKEVYANEIKRQSGFSNRICEGHRKGYRHSVGQGGL